MNKVTQNCVILIVARATYITRFLVCGRRKYYIKPERHVGDICIKYKFATTNHISFIFQCDAHITDKGIIPLVPQLTFLEQLLRKF